MYFHRHCIKKEEMFQYNSLKESSSKLKPKFIKQITAVNHFEVNHFSGLKLSLNMKYSKDLSCHIVLPTTNSIQNKCTRIFKRSVTA